MMARDDSPTKIALTKPQVSLVGRVDEELLKSLAEQLDALTEGTDPVTVELTTLGGDAEYGRRAMLDIEEARSRLRPRPVRFLGKTVVYSAGVTLMSGFPPEDRFLTEDAVLLIHCRQLEEEVRLSGPIRSSLPLLKSKCHEIETGIQLEVEAFGKLIAGTRLSMDELIEKALYNWYVPAREALELGLVAGIADSTSAKAA